MQLVTPYTIIEAACLSVAVYCLRGQGLNSWGIQRFYLMIVLATELTGTYIRHARHVDNLFIYNVFLVVECLVISTVLVGFIRPLTRVNLKPWLFGWWVLFSIGYVLEWVLKDQRYVYLNYTIVGMSLVFAAACGYYFYRLLAATPHGNVSHPASLWWVSGTAIFYFGGMAINVFLDLIIEQPVVVGVVFLHDGIANLLNLLLYGLWICSYITKYRHPNS